MTFDSFRKMNYEIETILQTYIGKSDRENLSARIHVKLSPTYINLSFKPIEDFRLDVSKESSCYHIDVKYERKSERMEEKMWCTHLLKIVDGKFTEVVKKDSE